jgi:hypothetical protein
LRKSLRKSSSKDRERNRREVKLSAESKTLVVVALFLAFLSMVYFIPGCSKEEKFIRNTVEDYCKDIIDNPRLSENTKILATKALEGWKNEVLEPDPILIHAGYGLKHAEDGGGLFLTMSDEDYDFAGFGIREFHKQSDSTVAVVEEEYPIFPQPKIRCFQLIAFKERKTLLDTKDDEAWINYVNKGADRLFIYRGQEYPVVWISVPNPPTVEVEVWIYDLGGHKSEPVPLERGLPWQYRRK